MGLYLPGPFSFPLLLRASESSIPSCACAAFLSYLSLSPLHFLSASSDDRPVGYGAPYWHTAPYIGRTHRCKRTCGSCIASLCTSTWAFICSRRQRPDKSIVLVPWCEPPAPSHTSSARFPPRSLLVELSDWFVHIRL